MVKTYTFTNFRITQITDGRAKGRAPATRLHLAPTLLTVT